MARRPHLWVDLVSPAHPFFFRSLLTGMGAELETTVRKKTETVSLAREAGFDFSIVGRDFDNELLRKLGIPLRTAQLAVRAPRTDVSLSSRNAMCILASKARRIPSIHFTDNDITAYVEGLYVEELYNRLEARATHNVVPAAFETSELTRWGTRPGRIHTYDGYKEDVSVAEFVPDPSFPDRLPFASGEYIVVRPEALDAAYVSAERSIVPDILSRSVKSGISVVYLPRGRGDTESADPYSSEEVYVPAEALSGLQLAWHARCVLTGSGTMAREAACMETPAVSFFPETPLSVDQRMIEEGRIMRSRDPDEIVSYLRGLSVLDIEPDRTRSQAVRDDVAELTATLINNVT